MNQGQMFHPPPPGQHLELKERRPEKQSRKDAAASMFWSFISQVEGRLEDLEEKYLQLIRAMGEQRRRLDTAEESLHLYRQIFGDSKPAVRFFCIACSHEFALPLDEAQGANFTVTCPKCWSWCLPYPENVQREYSAKEIAVMAGVSYSHAKYLIKGHGFDDGTPGQRWRMYTSEETKRIVELLKSHKRKAKK